MSSLEKMLSDLLGEDNLKEAKKSLDKVESLCSEAKDILKEQVENLEKKASECGDLTKDQIDKLKLLKKYTGRQKRIYQNKVNHGFNTTNVYQEARYILEEVAELMRAIEKHDMPNIKEELADIVIFAYGCAEVAGVGDLDEEIFTKMKLNEQRIYKRNDAGDFIKEDSENE